MLMFELINGDGTLTRDAFSRRNMLRLGTAFAAGTLATPFILRTASPNRRSSSAACLTVPAQLASADLA